ncbi:TonB-dependent receptor [Altererythrobacter indicus]|uniref:TonB-dependent receptor n=1 Tax=Altericroceibacterium indicum TaxID=374177 RepID=A0A845A5G3_9SPHN|nr:TonB-dependent receptor [Altericroceibacterium indicum]MXP25420.1 TonB-dependent receptor [Altericroceibacterium indicum]
MIGHDRCSVIAILCAATIAMVADATPATAKQTTFNIPAGDLTHALPMISQVSDIQIIADPRVLDGHKTRGVVGTYSVRRALRVLLQGTGLTFRESGGVFLIVPAPKARPVRRQQADSFESRKPQPHQKVPEPLIVIGQRLADQAAIAIKEREVNISDAVAADDVQRLPDSTVVDALRRIPGVSVLPIADNEHPRDVPIAPVVRGLSQAYNNVTINGLAVASTGIPDAQSNSVSRGVRLDILPASVISSLVVIKTFTPDLNPNAIGGAIDLRTRSAFENGGERYVSVDGGAAVSSRHGEIRSQAPLGTHASLTASDTFGSDDQFGIVLSANYRHRENNSDIHGTSDSNYLEFFNVAGEKIDDPVGGAWMAVPRQDKYWHNSSDRRHWGLTARAEAELGDWHLSMFGGNLLFRDGYTRNEIIIAPLSDEVQDITPTSGRFSGGEVQVGYRDGVTHSKTRIAQFVADWQASPHDKMQFAAGYSRASLQETYKMVKFTGGNADAGTAGNFGFGYDTSAFQYSFNPPPAAYYDLANYGPAYWRKRERHARSRIGVAQLDWRHNMERGESGAGFAAGLSYTDARFSYHYQNVQYRSKDQSLTLNKVGKVTDVRLPFNQEHLSFIVIDPTLAWRLFDQNRQSIFQSDTLDDNLRDDFTHGETNLAAYATARLSNGGLDILGGFRLEQTRAQTDNFSKIEEEWKPEASSAHYTRLLPSLLADWEPGNQLRVRAAYSRTIGRPDYEDYAPRSVIEFAQGATVGDPDAKGVSVTLGNPEIMPRLSDNFDLSFEWTMPGQPNGFLSAALFHKAISHEIFEAQTEGYAMDGVFYRYAEVHRPVNADAAHVSGVELNAMIGSLRPVSHHLTHVGFSANWTLLDGAIKVLRSDGTTRHVPRFVSQPERIGNVSLFYNDGAFELRGAYNATGLALRSLAPDRPDQDIYWAPRHQFDLQARYRFQAGPSVVLDIANITEERVTSLTGPEHRWLKDSYAVPRTISLSLVWGIGA